MAAETANQSASDVEGGVISPSTLTGGCQRGASYHASRSLEELDQAERAEDPAVRSAHECLAKLHLVAAARLKSEQLRLFVASRVD